MSSLLHQIYLMPILAWYFLLASIVLWPISLVLSIIHGKKLTRKYEVKKVKSPVSYRYYKVFGIFIEAEGTEIRLTPIAWYGGLFDTPMFGLPITALFCAVMLGLGWDSLVKNSTENLLKNLSTWVMICSSSLGIVGKIAWYLNAKRYGVKFKLTTRSTARLWDITVMPEVIKLSEKTATEICNEYGKYLPQYCATHVYLMLWFYNMLAGSIALIPTAAILYYVNKLKITSHYCYNILTFSIIIAIIINSIIIGLWYSRRKHICSLKVYWRLKREVINIVLVFICVCFPVTSEGILETYFV